MAGRIVLFGATGYTGGLAAHALVERGVKPVLASRSKDKLERLSVELGGLETASADIERPESVAALVEQGDVLLTTVGPFARWGGPALEAAIGAGAHYIDSTGETPFIRQVFEHYGPRAERASCALMTAFGYDWVPGNLAGALALERAGERATRVEIGYFMSGAGLGGMSGGTRASTVGVMLAPSYTFRGGRIVTERGAKRVQRFTMGGKPRAGISVGTTEAFALPHSYPQLREVDVYLGWFGSMSPVMQYTSAGLNVAAKIPGFKKGVEALGARFVKTSIGGPNEQERSGGRSHFIAVAYDSIGNQLSRVQVDGIDGYSFTGKMLAWAAERASQPGAVKKNGAVGPVEAFGLDELQAGVAECGLSAVS